MTSDLELETWQREWREQTEPLPELKKKIKRQNLHTVLAVVAICACLIVSTVWALRSGSSFMFGVASGIGFAGSLAGSYGLWLRRGAWRPTAQTTLAYAELSHKRAVARVRLLHFMFLLLLTTTVLLAGFVSWNWRHFHLLRDGVILAALVVELFYIRHKENRKKLEIPETQKLIDDLKA